MHNHKKFTDLKHQSNIPTHYSEKNNKEDKYTILTYYIFKDISLCN
jgi:hypothetical protein